MPSDTERLARFVKDVADGKYAKDAPATGGPTYRQGWYEAMRDIQKQAQRVLDAIQAVPKP
jgi:hypothetical protein